MRAALLLVLTWLTPGLLATGLEDAPWLLVDTAAAGVFVMSGERVLESFDGIAVGRGGVRDLHYEGDNTTPRGQYRVSRINPRSRFHIFIGLDYPTLAHAERAFLEERLSARSYARIAEAARRGVPAPEDTELGGAIGIHGTGSGSRRVHRTFNWTQGCIALTNAQIERLARYVWPGMRVEIR